MTPSSIGPDIEIKRLEILAARHRERIELLEKAAAEAEAERRVRDCRRARKSRHWLSQAHRHCAVAHTGDYAAPEFICGVILRPPART